MAKQESADYKTARWRRDADPLGANSEIGRKLKQYYEDLVKEEIPDRFADLLGQLERAEKAGGKE